MVKGFYVVAQIQHSHQSPNNLLQIQHQCNSFPLCALLILPEPVYYNMEIKPATSQIGVSLCPDGWTVAGSFMSDLIQLILMINILVRA